MSLIEVHSKFVGYAIFLEGVSEYSVIATFPDPFQEDFRQLWDAPTLLHLLAFLVYHKYTSASTWLKEWREHHGLLSRARHPQSGSTTRIGREIAAERVCQPAMFCYLGDVAERPGNHATSANQGPANGTSCQRRHHRFNWRVSTRDQLYARTTRDINPHLAGR